MNWESGCLIEGGLNGGLGEVEEETRERSECTDPPATETKGPL